MPALLEVANLSAWYGGNEALHSVDFSVNEGECVVVLGPNGAGKSTLMRSVMGLTQCKGQINFAGKSLLRLPTQQRAAAGLTLVPETRGIFGPLTVSDNLDLGTYLSRRDLKETREMVFSLFPRLKERTTQIAGTLSGGEQQMLAIGRALLSRPKLLLLDEPSLGLAPRLAEEIFVALQSLLDFGLTLAVVEQRAPLALEIADRTYVLRTGNISAPLSPEELQNSTNLLDLYIGSHA